jgi:heptosyltransferase-2
MIKEICKNLPERAVNLAGLTSIRELMALISVCTAFLTNDSGPMHLAAAMNIPLVALFGSTDEIVTGPYMHGEVIHKHVSCSPCFQRVCPIDFRCMKNIEVREVATAIKKALIEGMAHASS